jgi:nitrite reductase/ring-hydroxylating ferredoxin subunit
VPFLKLCELDEIRPGTTKYCMIADRAVLLIHCEGNLYATAGSCPHQGNPLEGATLWGCLVDCPFHHFQYDVRTGENYYPRNVYPEDLPHLQEQLRPLRTYDVELRGREVWVNLD